MSFIPLAGLKHTATVEVKDIVVVGDCPSPDAYKMGKQFDSSSESVIEQALHMSNLTKFDISILNMFPNHTSLKGLWVDNSKAYKRYFTEQGKKLVGEFENLMSELKPKVVVPLGPVAVQALLGRTDYTDIRGYPFQKEGYLVIPSLHPKDMIWSNYIWRFYLSNDLLRAREFAAGLLKVADPQLLIPATFEEACSMLREVNNYSRVSVDIEVNNYEVSCVGFSYAEEFGFSIPIDSRWSEEQETILWGPIAAILGNPAITKIGQNFIFDTYFLTYKMGIILRGYVEDTMMASSIAYPDFLKGLGFLGSVHTTFTYWKDQVKFKNIKEES